MKKDLHQQPSPQISIDEIWNRNDITIVDVRSPREFHEGSIPGARNIPLLNDLERSEVGTLYRQFGQQTAIEKGYELFEPRVSGILQQFAGVPCNQAVAVFCARGGMRSQIIVSLLQAHGYASRQVVGGYKAFRGWTLEALERFKIQKPVILHGKTGVGKTLVLNRLPNSLDLEGLADHRGSMFGGVGKTPVPQKAFDAALLKRLQELDNTRPVFIEGESRKIGRITLPSGLFRQMQEAPAVLLESSIETRARRTVDEYVTGLPHAVGQIREIIGRLVSDLGKRSVESLLLDFDREDYQACFKTILLEYYDRKYGYAMKNLSIDLVVSSEDLDAAARKIVAFFN